MIMEIQTNTTQLIHWLKVFTILIILGIAVCPMLQAQQSYVRDKSMTLSSSNAARATLSSSVLGTSFVSGSTDIAVNTAQDKTASYKVTVATAATSGNTYYVATNGNDGNNGTGLTTPFRTISKAASVVTAGDIVLIRGGVYKERVIISKSGTSANPITFKNYQNEKPVVDGSSLNFSDEYARRGLIQLNSTKYILIEGLSTVKATSLGYNGSGILVNGPNSSYVTIRGCSSADTRSSGIAAWGNTPTKTYNGITNLIIENCTVSRALDGGFQEHITIADGVENYEVRYNTVVDGLKPHPNNYPIGIDSKIDVRNGKVYGNEIYNLQSSNGIYVDAWDDEAYNIEIYNNIIHDVDGYGVTVGAEQAGTVHDIKIFNNIIYNTNKDGLKVNGAIGVSEDPVVYDIALYHNTVYKCQTSIWVQGNTSGNIDIYNNIFSQNNWNNGIYIYSSNTSKVKASNNIIDKYVGRSWSNPKMEEILGENAIQKSPSFVDGSNINLMLTSTSPAIDAGLSTAVPTFDYDGKSRPAGAGYDIGAYEYGSSTPPPTEGSGIGLAAEYFNNKTFSGNTALSRIDENINFNWGNGSPDSQINSDGFSARWTGEVQPLYSETYTFETESDDGIKLWVNGQLLVDKWQDMGPTKYSGTIALIAGEKYSIKIEYYENAGGAVAKLRWKSSSQAYQIIPTKQLYPTGISNGVFQQTNAGLVEIEVENYYNNLNQGGHKWEEVSPIGFSGTAALKATPNTGVNNNTGYLSNSPRLDYKVNFVKTGTHYIWTRGIGANGNDDSYHAGLDGTISTSADRISSFGTNWTWSKKTMDGPDATINVGSTGDHTFNIWMREDGFVIDKVVITNDFNYEPTDNNARIGNFIAPEEGNTLELKLYPNPVSNVLTLENLDFKGGNLKVTNVVGQVVLQKELSQSTIDFTAFSKGIYLIDIEKDGNVFRGKVVKE